eukprot:gene10697-10854_t
MKTLNPCAPDFVPGTISSGLITAASAAGKTGTATANVLLIKTSSVSCGSGMGSEGGQLPTPNGLAEIAHTLSGDMTFEDMLFDNSSRRGSLVGQLQEVEEEEEDEDEHFYDPLEASAPCNTATLPQGGHCSGDSDSGSAHSETCSNLRSCPMPISALRKAGEAAAAEADATQQQEAAAVAKAQRELTADAALVQSSAVTDTSQPKLGPQDFEILRVVGQGAFGKVFQVRARASGKVFAMKVMRKERILQKDHGDYVRAERDLLTAVVHPYIVTLRYSFQTASKLYLVLDFLNGGHLFFNLYRQGVFDEDVARLYTAEIVAALAYLHGRGIIHRDLKPENVLLDSDGHIRLTDFGLAKGNMNEDNRTNSFIGTMEYMAPEIIEGKGHGQAVDWWSTGILLYEMLAGVPPFRAKSRQQLQQQIVNAKPKFPKFLGDQVEVWSGLQMRACSLSRLGGGANGAEAVKKHAFFKNISWAKLEARQLESKFKPGVKCSLSVENFDKIWTEQRPVDSPCGTPTDPEAAAAFEGFTYIAPSFIHSSMAQLQLSRGATEAAGAL